MPATGSAPDPTAPTQGPSRPDNLTILAALLAVLAGGSFLISTVLPASARVREGFPGYYTAARLVLEGRWSERVYDDRFFAQETLAVTDGDVGEIFRPNPPTAALVALPLAGFDVLTARRLWLAFEVALVIAIWLLLLAALPALRAPPLALSILALTLVWAPLREDVSMGQVYVPLLALQAVAFLALERGRSAVAGIALGVATAAKVAALPWLLVALVRREGRLLLGAVAAITVLVVISLGFAGADGWSAFWNVAWHDLTEDRPSLAVTAYQSTAGLLRHLLAPDATWNPGAIANLPLIARALAFALGGWVVIVTALVARRARPDLAAALAVAAFVIALNVAQEYAHTLLLLPAVVAIARVVGSAAVEPPAVGSIADESAIAGSPVTGRGRTAWLAVAIALLAAPLPYRDPAFDAGWLALLAYPRVYGAWLLWAWLAREIGLEARQDQRATALTR